MKKSMYRFPLKKLNKIYNIIDDIVIDDYVSITITPVYESDGSVYYKFYENGEFIFNINRIEIVKFYKNEYVSKNTYTEVDSKYYLEFYKKTKNVERFNPNGSQKNNFRSIYKISETQFEYIERSIKLNFI